MVLAYHLSWTAYGWWLPNDPRGSTSAAIASDIIAQLGKLHYGRKVVQPASRNIRRFYELAMDALKFSLLRFTDLEVEAISAAFACVVSSERYTCYACAILPDHVHLIIPKHRDAAEQMIGKLQRASAARVIDMGDRRTDHPVWGGPGWKVFLDSPADIERTVWYVEANPKELHLAPQRW